MNKSLEKLSLIFIILLVSFVFSAVSAKAALQTPYFTYTGSFSYDWDSKTLTTSITSINNIFYKDGTSAPNYNYPPYTVDDPLIGGDFTLGTLQNSAANPLEFGPGGTLGDVSFSLDNGDTHFMDATLNNFTVTVDEYGTRLNPGYDMNHVVNIITNDGVTDSKFLDDVNSYNAPVGNLYMDFNFASSSEKTDFTGDGTGTISGEFSVAPEPVSSALFITGGVTLAFRRYRKK